jgi:hypothetical protein
VLLLLLLLLSTNLVPVFYGDRKKEEEDKAFYNRQHNQTFICSTKYRENENKKGVLSIHLYLTGVDICVCFSKKV